MPLPQLHGSRCIRNAVKAIVHAFESQKTLVQVMEHLQPRDSDPGGPALRITELAANHWRPKERRMTDIPGAWFKAPKQACTPSPLYVDYGHPAVSITYTMNPSPYPIMRVSELAA